MTRTILHIDMDAFFASVEQLDHPEWRGRPLVVGAAGDARGVVAAASYEARRFGIRSAMPSREAARLCPEAIFVAPRRGRYEEVSQQVFSIFGRYTPEVEPLSIDEAFLDVTGALSLFGPGREVAERIRGDIRRELGLTASAGVAPNKFLAKLASEMNKPDGLTEVPTTAPGILAFLAPLPLGRLWGVGPVLEARLRAAGFATVGDVQSCKREGLDRVIGRHAADHLLRLAIGEDDREVETEGEDKSLSREHTFSRDVKDRVVLERSLLRLVEDVGRRLRATGHYASTARIKIRWQGFRTITRQQGLDPACCDDISLRESALRLFRNEPLLHPVRLIGFGVSDLVDQPPAQLLLFGQEGAGQEKRERLSQSVDRLQARFGERAPRFGGG